MSHTPGPWIWAEYRQGLNGANGKPVLDFAAHEGMFLGGEDHATEDADASLIAAAPDLLAACKWLVEYHEGDGAIVTLDEYLSRAKAAIAKAEGK